MNLKNSYLFFYYLIHVAKCWQIYAVGFSQQPEGRMCLSVGQLMNPIENGKMRHLVSE